MGCLQTASSLYRLTIYEWNHPQMGLLTKIFFTAEFAEDAEFLYD
jgi:hypothetical protein